MQAKSVNYGQYLRISVVTALLFLLALGSGPAINYFLKHQASEAIRDEAEAQAKEWALRLVRQFPEIGTMLQTGEATTEQVANIKNSVSIGGVFRFKLFAPDGSLIFVSDESQFIAEGARPHTESALEVFRTGQSEISVEDGRAKPNRPDTYVEAYIPAKSLDGQRIGVIEVYVDVTEANQVLRASFSALSRWLIICSAIVFLIPAAAVLWRAHHLRQQDRKLAELQRYDQLTHVLNRNALSEGIATVFDERDADETIGVLFVDVDRFKEVNDTLGHEQGDITLNVVAQALRDSMHGERDLLGRYGGDEFVILLRDASATALRAVVRDAAAKLRAFSTERGLTIEPTLSIGAHLSAPGESSKDALQAADVAVYHAKRTGRNRMVEYSLELDADRRRETRIEDLLRRSIEDDLLTLSFQPLFDARTRSILGCEALLRLRDLDGEIISPGEFIPIAERLNLMDELGGWVLRRAIQAAQQWPSYLFVSVNLSVAQFRNGDLPARIAKVLTEHGFDASRLELEITESMIIEDEQALAAQLAALKATGVRLAIDDFGAGATSVGHFWKYDFDKLKLDRSLMRVCQAQPERGLRVLQSIVAFSHALNCRVVAEGVEQDDQLAINAAAGVDQIQGFLLARPMPEEAIQSFLEDADKPFAQAV